MTASSGVNEKSAMPTPAVAGAVAAFACKVADPGTPVADALTVCLMTAPMESVVLATPLASVVL